MIPKGKGIYGRSRYLDKKYAIFLRDHEIEWYVPISLSKLTEQVATGKKYGIAVHGGMIPLPNGSRPAALNALTTITIACRKAKAGSRHLDMEEVVFWQKVFCEQFVAQASEINPDGKEPVRDDFGITCYGSHKGKLAGMQGGDYYLDQVYDKGKIETKDQNALFNSSLEKFFKISGQAPVGLGVGVFLNYKNSDGTKVLVVKPIDRFRRHLKGVPRGTTFVAVWSLPSFQTNPERFVEHWRAIAEWVL